MSTSTNADQEFINYLLDLLQSIGPVTAKRMFGGHGIFLEGLMFALVSDRCLYLKADAQNKPDFIAQGLEPFSYTKQGKPVNLQYYQCPEEALEDLQQMHQWANSAFAAALRAAAKKAPKKAAKKT